MAVSCLMQDPAADLGGRGSGRLSTWLATNIDAQVRALDTGAATACACQSANGMMRTHVGLAEEADSPRDAARPP